jgi:dTDP-glucose 4,6-dehydratase
MNLLVTGGAGFIGSNFLTLLTSGRLEISPNRITVIDKLTYASDINQIQPLIDKGLVSFIQGDICDSNLINSLVDEHDHVVNFAAESHVDNSIKDSSSFVKSNILGVDNILTAIKGKPKTKLLQISTDEVYGSIDSGSWNEKCPLNPNSPYAATKAAADLLVIAAHRTHKIQASITRCSNNYGPRQNSEKLIPKLIQQALSSKNLTLYGNGTNVREWIHVNDHCKAITWAIKNAECGEIYNIGSNVELTNLQIATAILGLIPESKSKVEFVTDRPGHDFRYSLDDTKVREMGVNNEENFMEGLSKTIEWYRFNPEFAKKDHLG